MLHQLPLSLKTGNIKIFFFTLELKTQIIVDAVNQITSVTDILGMLQTRVKTLEQHFLTAKTVDKHVILSQEDDYKDTLNHGTHSPNKFEETNKNFLLNDKDKDFKRSFIDSIKPSWNGIKSSWNDFWIEWTFYWNNLKLLV